jgi:tetratricopeptide (TPR) repeat protein
MVNQRNSIIVATTSASLWVLMPLLATASLLVVQRMTTLSATFVMLALLGYLSARAIIHDRPKQALLGMSLSLAVGTVLATLTKESGALLPVFVLVIEATVLERPVNIKTRVWRTWQTVFLVLPLVLLLVYLATCINYPEHLLVRRDFNAWERVLTETRVLWIYLSKAIVGIPGQLGVYQYPPTVSRSLINPLTLLASLTWMSLLVISILWRRRYPLFAVAVLWYLAGHLIESTVVGLELYFEHRNYLPIIGPLFGLCSFLVLYLEPRRRRIAAVSVAVLAIVNAWFLYSFATLWGDSSLAARYWANRYPDSPRAVLRMATFRLAEDGPGPALQTIDSFVTANPEHAYMYISALNLLCQLDPENDYRKIIARLEQELPKIHYNNVTSWMLVELLQTAEKSNCNGVDGETVTLLAKILRSNPDYAVQPTYNKFYFKTLAYVAWQQGKYDETIHYLRQVIDYGRGSDVNVMMVMALGNLGRFDDAREFIDQVRNLAPLHPAKAAIWQQELDNLSEYVQQLEQKTRRPHSSQPG